MTIQLFLNGKPEGSVSFLPDGTPVVAPGAWSILARLPVAVFPLVDPAQAQRALIGLSKRDFTIPGIGVVHVEVFP